MISLLLTNLALEVISDRFPIEEVHSNNVAFNFDAASSFLSFFIEGILLAFMWIYFLYFFKKKKEFISRQKGEEFKRAQFTNKEKALIIWTAVVLLSNTICIGVDNAIEIVFLFIESYTTFEPIWKLIVHFWF